MGTTPPGMCEGREAAAPDSSAPESVAGGGWEGRVLAGPPFPLPMLKLDINFHNLLQNHVQSARQIKVQELILQLLSQGSLQVMKLRSLISRGLF